MKIGIIVPHLGNSQLSFDILRCLPKLHELGEVYLYQELLVPKLSDFNCGLFQLFDIYSFNGLLISTTIDNSITSFKAKNGAKKVFYSYDLEWMRGENDFLRNQTAYSLKTYCRSQDHARLISNYSNTQPIIAKDLVELCSLEKN